MVVKCKLIDGLDTPIELSAINKNRVYKMFRIEPNKIKTLLEEDTCESVINELKDYTLRFTIYKEQELKKKGIDFKRVVCKSCGGNVIKLEVKPIEVIIDDTK